MWKCEEKKGHCFCEKPKRHMCVLKNTNQAWMWIHHSHLEQKCSKWSSPKAIKITETYEGKILRCQYEIYASWLSYSHLPWHMHLCVGFGSK